MRELITEPEELSGLLKKIKKALKPPKSIRKALTPPKEVRKSLKDAGKRIEKGIKRLKKANLQDYLVYGPWGVADPKVGKIVKDYINPAALEMLKVLPGGQIISEVASKGYEMLVEKEELENLQKELSKAQDQNEAIIDTPETLPQEAAPNENITVTIDKAVVSSIDMPFYAKPTFWLILGGLFFIAKKEKIL